MKKISIVILVLVAAFVSCKKTPEVNLKYVDIERDLVTVGTTTANIQCDYDYITTLKKAYLYYGEGEEETDMTSAEMQVVQNTLYVELASLKENTTYHYYYEFVNGFNSMRSVLKTFKTEKSPDTPSVITLPTVITAEVTEITTNSAKSGGEVTNDGGAEVIERGICWSTNANPSLTDSYVAAGTGTGAFTVVMSGLQANTTYHVRAYATNEKGTAYGLDKEFATVYGGGNSDHEYVDLCLPSGILWATCNVGATYPEEYGDYFAWGEIQPKSVYGWYTYQYCNGSINTLIKYCNDANYGYNGFTDNLTILLPEDDAATANWGSDWRTPSKEEWQELLDNTTRIWTTQNGVNGWLLTASCGNSLFLPAVGYREESSLNDAGNYGVYWSSSLCLHIPPFDTWVLYFNPFLCSMGDGGNRGCGSPVRAVRNGEIPIPSGNAPEGAIDGLFTINENGDQVYFSQGNLQYQASMNTWRFAEHQWDYVGTQTPAPISGAMGGTVSGSDNYGISSTYDGWIDLFGWGTSGWDNGNLYYHPWNTAWYSNSSEFYGPCGCYDLTGTYVKADWGVYNAISNGGNVVGHWRSLTTNEWDYLFNDRDTPSGTRFAKANVNGVNGVILLPDNWDNDIYQLNHVNSIDWTYYWSNSIT